LSAWPDRPSDDLGDQGFGQMRLLGLRGGEAGLDAGGQCEQFFEPGDDAGLFGEGWRREEVTA